jgi:hypothetical protein
MEDGVDVRILQSMECSIYKRAEKKLVQSALLNTINIVFEVIVIILYLSVTYIIRQFFWFLTLC